MLDIIGKLDAVSSSVGRCISLQSFLGSTIIVYRGMLALILPVYRAFWLYLLLGKGVAALCGGELPQFTDFNIPDLKSH